jgi:uncharacterized protein YbaA (DUF1428 family)
MKTMAYIDGFAIPVPVTNKGAYKALSEAIWPLYQECGAQKVVEAWGDDVPDGKTTSFPMAVKLEPNETVVFSWVWWPDKATRDAGNAKFMADPRHTNGSLPDMCFEGKRVIYSGFEVFVDL